MKPWRAAAAVALLAAALGALAQTRVELPSLDRRDGEAVKLVGERDDWTAAAPCVELAARSGGAMRTVVYPDAFHGFDGSAAPRMRRDVPNGVNPGQGVTVGANPAAREASQREMLTFLRERLAP